MKSGRPLQQLAGEVVRQNASKRDYLAPTARLHVRTEERAVGVDELQRPKIARIPTLEVKDHGTFAIRPNAIVQLAQYLDIPLAYLRRCEQQGPELFASNVNHWLSGRQDRRFVRTLDGNARALLSDRYCALDNHDLLEAILPVLHELGTRIDSCEVTEEKLYIKAVNARLEREVAPGDVVQAGVVISNSEVGCGSLRIAPLILRLVCQNGMIATDQTMRKYHVGRTMADGTIDDVWTLLSDDTKRKTNAAVWGQVRDVARSALSEALFFQIVDKMRAAKEQPIEAKSLNEVVVATSMRYHFNADERTSVLGHLIAGGDLSQYGLLNAITRTSQDVSSYDRATELEEIGGKVLDLTRGDWNSLSN